MGGINVFDILFTNKKSSKYQEALDSISRISSIVNNVTMEYPDVSSKEIKTVQNHWLELTHPIGKGVHVMGLHSGDDYKSLLLHYQRDSYISSHFHSKEWEVVMVLDGKCIDESTGTVLTKGDVYIIPRNAVHNIKTGSNECYMYVMYSSNKKHLKISEDEQEIAKRLIGKRHSFKA